MGLGYVVVLERELDGIDPRLVDGRALAAERHTLDAAAHEMDLPGLGEFVAFSHDEAETLAADMKFDAPTVGDPTGRWFSCANGLEVVGVIQDFIEENPDEVREAAAIREGLRAMREVLKAAEAAGVRFRLSVEY